MERLYDYGSEYLHGHRCHYIFQSCFQPHCIGFFNPFLNADLVAIKAGLASNCGEFAIIKTMGVN